MDNETPEEQSVICITAPGGPEVLRSRRMPVPQPSSGEVLIKVEAAGVNRHDCNQRRRGPSPVHSDTPGLEVAGVVVALGRGVASIDVGQRVCALTDGGGYASHAIAQAAQTLPMPEGLDWVEAAALPEAAFTVWHNFFDVARLGPGESVLLHGGTSGVGTLAIQVLAALGHPVYATCGSVEKVAAARQLGARAAINYRSEDFVDVLSERTAGRGVDVILDMSGGQHSEANLKALARRGRLVHLSPGNGAFFQASLLTLMAKEAVITGSLLRPLPDSEKAAIAERLRHVVWPLIESGRVKPVVHCTFPLADAPKAHRLIEAGEHIGKVVLLSGT